MAILAQRFFDEFESEILLMSRKQPLQDTLKSEQKVAATAETSRLGQ